MSAPFAASSRATAWATIIALVLAAAAAAAQAPGREAYDRAVSLASAKPLAERVTGVVVPHHAPALPLAVMAFSLAAGSEVERVVILCPDHYRRSTTPFATTDRTFETMYGPVRVDRAAVEDLLRDPLFAKSDLFDNEHGVGILLPLVRIFFPKAAIVPVAARITATKAECERLAALLHALNTPRTLVVLSADFSHHLPPGEARRMDQQSLAALAGDDPRDVMALRQPANVDTLAMLHVQALVQKRIGSPFRALANTDTSELLGRPVKDATSYVAGLWGPKGPVSVQARRVVFAGDTFTGRSLAAPLGDPARRAALARRVLALTGGADMVVNLEGVLAEDCPPPSNPRQLCMEAGSTLALLKEMNVKWVSLANNHTMDLGPQAYSRMKHLLGQAGIAALEKNTVADAGPLRLAAFTALENGKSRAETAILAAELAVLDAAGQDARRAGPGDGGNGGGLPDAAAQAGQDGWNGGAREAGMPDAGVGDAAGREADEARLLDAPAKPLAVFVHWGQEWAAGPDALQRHLYDAFRSRGAGLVIGAHSHRPGVFECGDGGCLASSLGNFIFDQTRPEAGGMLLEVTVFGRGTWFARSIPLGNMGGDILSGAQGANQRLRP